MKVTIMDDPEHGYQIAKHVPEGVVFTGVFNAASRRDVMMKMEDRLVFFNNAPDGSSTWVQIESSDKIHFYKPYPNTKLVLRP